MGSASDEDWLTALCEQCCPPARERQSLVAQAVDATRMGDRDAIDEIADTLGENDTERCNLSGQVSR